MPPRVGVISPCGWGNLGDAAIVAATLEGIRARVPTADLFAITLNPGDTERRHGIPAFALAADRYNRADSRLAARRHDRPWLRSALERAYRVRHFLANLRNELRHALSGLGLVGNADLLIVAGGGQLDDYWGGAWAHPFNLLKLSLAARVAGTPLAILSVGYGTRPSWLSRLFLRAVLRLSAYRSFRDPRTASVARERFALSDAIVVPDLAFGLAVRPPAPSPARDPAVVAISPIAFADPRSWPLKDAALYESYLGSLAQFVQWLDAQGHALVFFCTDNKDVRCLRDLHARGTVPRTAATDAARPEPYYKEVDELVAQLADADFVVASRLHGVILAHRLAKPVLAVSYDWKVDAHMEQVGESQHVLDIRALTVAALIDGFRRLVEGRAETEQRLRWTAAEYAQQISAQFDLIARKFVSASPSCKP